MIFVFSAGNGGPAGGTIGSPGNGKNMITVGASENFRQSDEDGIWLDGCGIGPAGADNAMDVITFPAGVPGRAIPSKRDLISARELAFELSPASNESAAMVVSVCSRFSPSRQAVFRHPPAPVIPLRRWRV